MAAAPATPADASGSRLRTNLVVIVVVVILLVFVALVALTNLHVVGGASASVIKPSGTKWPIAVGSYEVLSFTLQSSASVTGSIQASNGVVVYLMTPSAYQGFTATGSPLGATWTSGPMTSSSISVSLGSGSWYMIFMSPSPGQATNVALTSDLIATPA